jgi:hypothetical protein
MKKKKFYILWLFLLLITTNFFLTGCINNVAENGTIHGKLFVYEGNQPALNPVKVRVEAIPAYGDDATKRLNFRYVIVEPSAHGEYTIPDVPPGKYNIQFDIQNKDAAYAYLVKLGNQPNKGESYQTADEVPTAYIESGRTYEMPDYYVEKISSSGTGSFKGKFVYSPLEIPLEGITIKLVEDGSSKVYSGITNNEGVVVISDLTAGKKYAINVPENYMISGLANGSSATVYITDNQTIEKTYVLAYHDQSHNKPHVRGIINIPSNFNEWIQKDDILAYLNMEGQSASNVTIQVQDGFYFDVEVEPWISKYQLRVSIKEPFFSNTVIYPLPALQPGQAYDLPDNAINLEVAHKDVTVKIYPPGNYIVSGEVVFSVTINSKLKSFIARAAGNYWMASVDLPYSVAKFDGVTVLKIGKNMPSMISIRETAKSLARYGSIC